jgi:crotonobetainyl-CoA:carnitine CoA-transferase CaiB-like acyl-CoA transferase
MTIAGGIMGALFHRERTGEALPLDVSLLGVGMWAMSPAIALSLQLDMPWRPGPSRGGGPGIPNPLVGTYVTQDGRFLAFSCLQGFRYWPSACRVIGRVDLITDERFSSHEQLAANAGAARAILKEIFESAPLSEWRVRLADFEGQWAVAQDSLELTKDVQVEANGHLGQTATADGVPFTLVTTPVQFAGQPSPPKRAPEFNEHCEDILASIGVDADAMLELKIEGVVA